MGTPIMTTIRANVVLLDAASSSGGRSTSIEIPEEATASSLEQLLRKRGEAVPHVCQLVANGKEMSANDRISNLGEFFFRSNAIYVREINPNACREWQRTGRCKMGSKCPHCGTHEMKFSPRYIAHAFASGQSPTVSPAVSP